MPLSAEDSEVREEMSEKVPEMDATGSLSTAEGIETRPVWKLFTIVFAGTDAKLEALCEYIGRYRSIWRYRGVAKNREEWMKAWDAFENPDVILIHNVDCYLTVDQVGHIESLCQSLDIGIYHVVERDTNHDDQALGRLSIDLRWGAPIDDYFATIAAKDDDSLAEILDGCHWDLDEELGEFLVDLI